MPWLGVIVPSVNIVVEEWYPRVVPDGVSVHFARMLIGEDTTPERIIAMDREDGVRAIRQLAGCRPHAIAYGCLSAAWHAEDGNGVEEQRELSVAAVIRAVRRGV